MRVAVITDLTRVNSIYRALPLVELASRGHGVVVDTSLSAPQRNALRGVDVVHVYRFHDAATRQHAARLRAAGVAIVWDNDDDLTAGLTRSGSEQKKHALNAQRLQAEMSGMVRLAHVVTTPSSILAESYAAWGAERVRVVDNYLPRAYAAEPPGGRDAGSLTIGWIAAAEHMHDLRRLGLRDVLGSLLDRHPGLRVVSVGIDLGLPGDRYRRHGIVEYDDLSKHVAAFDIGIAPIADVPFNRARSTIKLKEYAAVGVPWLASPIGPYREMGEQQGGRLVADGDWEAELDRLVCDARARRKLAKRGRKWAQGQTVARNLDAWEGALSEAVERARA